MQASLHKQYNKNVYVRLWLTSSDVTMYVVVYFQL